ncbi:MAG: penicillin-binding protein activator [Salinarimonadaceae bacterium]|nr:MAG: penicillin-binding protein activator [Salinarimonadaceae bacterium]
MTQIAINAAPSQPRRRKGPARAFAPALVAALGLALASCISPFSDGPPGFIGGFAQPPAAEAIGDGAVSVALILPLSGSGAGAAAAQAMRNAATLAMEEFQDPEIRVLVKDDRGSPDGAREAAQSAVSEGVELILGPLFAASVQAAGTVAREAGVPVVAFSTDANVAAPGVYLMGFLPRAEVARVLDYAAKQGRRSVAALIPETGYGDLAEAQFRESAAQRGLRVVAIERYPAGQPQQAVARLAPAIAGSAPQADALFVPETPDGMAVVARTLQSAGFDPARVKPLGAGVWHDPDVLRLPALQGGWFAAPPQAGYEAFAARYQSRFGSQPLRIATLAYDAVSLAAALTRTQGAQRFSQPVLTNASGFAGADGVFRFRANGLNERGLAVFEVRDGSAATVSAAPQALAGGA